MTVVQALVWLLKPCLHCVYVGADASWPGSGVAAVVHRLTVGLLSIAPAVELGKEQAVAQLTHAMVVDWCQVGTQELLTAAVEAERQPGMHGVQEAPAADDLAADMYVEAVMARGSLVRNLLACCDQHCHKLRKPDAGPVTWLQEAAELGAC